MIIIQVRYCGRPKQFFKIHAWQRIKSYWQDRDNGLFGCSSLIFSSYQLSVPERKYTLASLVAVGEAWMALAIALVEVTVRVSYGSAWPLRAAETASSSSLPRQLHGLLGTPFFLSARSVHGMNVFVSARSKSSLYLRNPSVYDSSS